MLSFVPSIFRHRDYTFYVAGVALTQIGTNGTFTAMLYHVYEMTGSTVQVGLVGAGRGAATLILSPLGGHFADRTDRKTLLQITQALSMLVSFTLAMATYIDSITTWHLVLGSVLTSAGSAFDGPTRKAIIPALVPRRELVHAIAVINPTSQVGKLVGPGLAGVLIALGGPSLVYLVDGITYVGLIAILMVVTIQRMEPLVGEPLRLRASLAEGFGYVRDRPIIYQLMGLDISQTLFAAYRVVLPALAVDVLGIGPTGYGALSAAVPVGALVGGVVAYRLAGTPVRAGHMVLATTALYGAAAIVLAQVPSFLVALAAAVGLGAFDAIGTTVRHAAVLLETPDQMRGRVNAVYRMASGGGPSLGEMNIGALAGWLGATVALTVGGLVPIVYAVVVAAASRPVREYRTTEPEREPVDEEVPSS